MPTSPRARLSSIVTEPFDPHYGWLSDEDSPTHEAAPTHDGPPTIPPPRLSPGFDPTYPFSPFETPAAAGLPPMSRASFPPAPPPPPPDVPDLSATVVSPLSPPRTAWRSARERDVVAAPLIRPESFPPRPGRERDTTYRPKLEMDMEISEPAETTRRSQRISRSGSMAQRLGRMLSRQRSGGGRWSTVRRSRLGDDLEYTELAGLQEGDREDSIPFDVSSFGAEFVVPNQAVRAMEEHQWNENMAYTGTGEAVDLSNLTGFDDDDAGVGYSSVGVRRDSDAFSLHRAGTFDNYNKQSFFFSPGRHVPNWKPIVLQTWYILLLIAVTIGLIVSVEILYQLSDRHILRKGPGRLGGGLFAYINIEDLSTLQFAVWKYLPTIIGVLYGIAWKVTDEELKRSEPYYQLSKGSSGALAAESLNIEYHTVWSPMVPMAALKYRQFVVAAGSLASFLAGSAAPIFLSVVIRVDPSQKERQHMPHNGRDTVKRLVVDAVWTRLLQVTLAVIIILGIYIVVTLSRRRSGLLGDPSGIAGVAAMANKSHILMDFRDLDLANEKQIHRQLNKRTYILHKGALWQAQVLRESERDHSSPKPLNPHPLLLRVKGMLPFMAFCFAMLVLLPVMVYNDTANVIIDKTPWIITGISILIKSVWELLEKELRMLEPWWMLFRRNAESGVLTLDYSATIPGWIVVKAALNRHWLLAWVTVVTIMIEVLTVVLGSLDTQGGEESHLSSRMSFGLALGILTVVMITGGIVLHQRRQPFLPRQPGTISSVLAFIHQSKMLTEFEGTEQQSTKQRRLKLKKTGKRFGFGWYLGRDGKRHLGIDFEPLLEGFEAGRDPRLAVVDGVGSWEVFEGAG